MNDISNFIRDIKNIEVNGNQNTVNFGILYQQSIAGYQLNIEPIENITGTLGSLRGCLKREQQAYIDSDDLNLVEQLVSKLIIDGKQANPSQPLIIKGMGGLGKTRLALEICRYAMAHYQANAYLLRNSQIDEKQLERLMQQAETQQQHLILVIDYLEEFTQYKTDAYCLDSLVQHINQQGKGWVHLLVTTRHLPSEMGFPKGNQSFYEHSGAKKLTETNCSILNLNGWEYTEWRKHVCQKIYHKAHEENIDNPLIATLVNFYEKKETNLPKTEFQQDGLWLLNRLCYEFKIELTNTNKYKLICLLLLFPFHDNHQAKMFEQYPCWEEWLEALERTGLIHFQEQRAMWELGHDLLADIALAEFLSAYELPRQRTQYLNQLITDAQYIEQTNTMMRSLARAVRRAVAYTKLSEALDLLYAFANVFMPIKVKELVSDDDIQTQEQWLKLPEQLICSLFAPLYQKIQIVESMPELSAFDINETIRLFDKAYKDFRKRINIKNNDFYFIIALQISYGNINWFTKISTQLNQFHWQHLTLQFDDNLCQQLCFSDNLEQNDIVYKNMLNQQIWEKFSNNPNNETHLLAVKAALNDALEKDKQRDIEIYQKIWQQFGHNSYDDIRLLAAKAAVKYAIEKAKQGDIEIYQQVWKQFGQDSYNEIRLLVANIALLYALEKDDKQDNIEIYQQVWQQFGTDCHDEIRLQAAKAAFNYALKKDKQGDIEIYPQVWQQFGADCHDEIRLQAAKAAINYAFEKDKQGDIEIYQQVWQQFGHDSYDEIRLLAANAALVYVLEKAKQGDIEVCLQVWQQFGADCHDEIRLQAAEVACCYALEKAKQGDIEIFPQVWQQFGQDSYIPIQERALKAKLNYVDWQIALGQITSGYEQGVSLLNHPLLNIQDKTALHFLLWLAQPTAETRQACDVAVAALNGEATTWTFDEFAERIATLSDENQAYAKKIIQLFEHGLPE